MHNPWEGKKGIKLVGIEREILSQKFLEIIHSRHIKNLVNRLHIVINLSNTTKIIPIDQTNEEEIQSDITMTMLNNSFWWIFSTSELILLLLIEIHLFLFYQRPTLISRTIPYLLQCRISMCLLIFFVHVQMWINAYYIFLSNNCLLLQLPPFSDNFD